MASQPITASQYKRINATAAGTTVISDSGCNLNSITMGANYTGTITFYDTGTSTGTTATNLLIAVNNNAGSIPTSIHPGVRTLNGLTAVSGGTVDMLIGWDK